MKTFPADHRVFVEKERHMDSKRKLVWLGGQLERTAACGVAGGITSTFWTPANGMSTSSNRLTHLGVSCGHGLLGPTMLAGILSLPTSSSDLQSLFSRIN
ncbi:uncharacterized protein LOC111947510 isoform X4 [Oryzias latipes]